jgi:hypothetical protein
MRKVLTRHPQIEQQRLHRRIFFDYINQKNLALMVIYLEAPLSAIVYLSNHAFNG